MAFFQTAIFVDKFVGMYCLFMLFWLIPDVVIEWNPQTSSGVTLHLNQSQPSALFAPPEDWAVSELPSEQSNCRSSTYLPTLKQFLLTEGTNEVHTDQLLSTVKSLVERTSQISGAFVQLGTFTPPAIMAQATWRMCFSQRRRSLVIGAAAASKVGNTKPRHEQRQLFQQAGVWDSNVLIVDSLIDTVHSQQINSIVILVIEQSHLIFETSDTAFQELYSRVPLGGYIVFDQWHEELFGDDIPGIAVTADGSIAFWERTLENEHVQLQNGASLLLATDEKQVKLRAG